MKMTSFDLKNDLEVKFRGHQRKVLKQVYNTPKFQKNRVNRFGEITISSKSEEKKEEKKEKKEEKNLLSLSSSSLRG